MTSCHSYNTLCAVLAIGPAQPGPGGHSDSLLLKIVTHSSQIQQWETPIESHTMLAPHEGMDQSEQTDMDTQGRARELQGLVLPAFPPVVLGVWSKLKSIVLWGPGPYSTVTKAAAARFTSLH
jgi:hypothetical protein